MREERFHRFWVHIMASHTGTFYTGVTGDFSNRIVQHKSGDTEGLTQKYKCDRLVYYEEYDEVSKAIGREKRLKGWRRETKIALIQTINPRWMDLAENVGREMLFRGQSVERTP